MKEDDSKLVREWHIWAHKNNNNIFIPVTEDKMTPEYHDIIKRINIRLQQLFHGHNLDRLNIFVNKLNSLAEFAKNIK